MAIDTANMASNTGLDSDPQKSIESRKRLASPFSTPGRVTKISKTEKRSPSPHKPEIVMQWMERFESEKKPVDGMDMALALVRSFCSSAKKTGDTEDVQMLIDDVEKKVIGSEIEAMEFLKTMRSQIAEDDVIGKIMKDEKRFKAAYTVALDILTCLYYRPRLCLRKNDCRNYDFKVGEKRDVYEAYEISKYDGIVEPDKYDEEGIYNLDGYEGLIDVIQKFAGVPDEAEERSEVEINAQDILMLVDFPPREIRAIFDRDHAKDVASKLASSPHKLEDILGWVDACDSEHEGTETLMAASALMAGEEREGTLDQAIVEKVKRSCDSAKHFLESFRNKIAENGCMLSEARFKAAYSALHDFVSLMYYQPRPIIAHVKRKEHESYAKIILFLHECYELYENVDYGLLEQVEFWVGEDMMSMAAGIDFPPPGILPEKSGKAGTPIEKTDNEARAGDEEEPAKDANGINDAEEGAKKVEGDE